MHLAARLRWTLARHPSLYWLLVGTVALIVTTSVRSASESAQTARDHWGTSVVAYVTETFIARGDTVVAAAHDVPLALLPDGALVDAPPPGAVAAHDLAAGDVLDTTDIAAADSIPSAWVVLSVSTPAPRLVAGDRVAVLGAGALLCDGMVTAIAAPVDGEDTAVEVAMPDDCAQQAAPLLTLGEVVLGRRA